MLIIHVPDNASEYDHQRAREALAIALSVQPGVVVQSSEPVVQAPTSERVSQPAKGAPAKGSPEAKARMAKARAAKAAKSGQSTPATPARASDRMAALAAKAGITATPEPAVTSKPRKASSERYSLPEYVADTSDADFEALEAFAGRLVDDRKLKAFVLYLQGKADASSLEGIASRTGTLRSHAERVVTRARRGEEA